MVAEKSRAAVEVEAAASGNNALGAVSAMFAREVELLAANGRGATVFTVKLVVDVASVVSVNNGIAVIARVDTDVELLVAKGTAFDARTVSEVVDVEALACSGIRVAAVTAIEVDDDAAHAPVGIGWPVAANQNELS